MMSQVCCSRSLFLAVLCCFSAVFRALFSLLFWRCGHQKPGFLRRREGSSLYFSSIISEISERRHRQRPELSSCSCLFTASGLQEFQSLAPDLFSPRARTRARAYARKSASPRRQTSRAAEVVLASWTPLFAGATRERKGNSFVKLVPPGSTCPMESHRISDGQPHEIGAS